MSRKFFNVGHDDRFSPLPARAAYTATFLNAGAGNGSLERSKYKLIVFYNIKANPKPTELFFQCACNISQVCDQIRFAIYQRFYLWNQRIVLFGFTACND